MVAVVVSLLSLVTWQYLQIAAYKVAVAESGKAVAALATEISVKDASLAALQGAVATQNAAVQKAADEAKRKRDAALAARDAAVAALETVKGDNARLRRNWPQDCVAAVGMVRKELGL